MRAFFLIHNVLYLFRKIVLYEMSSGDIDRDRHTFKSLIEPTLLISRHMSYHIMVDLNHKSVLFKYGNKTVRCNKSKLRRLPPDKSLRAGKRVRLRIILWLIIDHELFFIESCLLPLRYDIDPFLFLYQLIVQHSHTGVCRSRECVLCRRSVVILSLDVDDHPLSAVYLSGFFDIYNSNSRLEIKFMFITDGLKLLDYMTDTLFDLFFIGIFQKKCKARCGIMSTEFISHQILFQQNGYPLKHRLALGKRMANAEIRISHHLNIHHGIGSVLVFLFTQDRISLVLKPKPVVPPGGSVREKKPDGICFPDGI